MPAAVTPSGVRDGDRAALAGLCVARGPSVLAYCRQVAGDARAADAAADAFAQFRAAVVATRDLAGLNPEALLINTTRKAAASRAARAPLGVCAVVPLLLAARADKTISPVDLDCLEQHLEGCWACRAPVARFHAAERAYRDPPEPAIDPAIAAQIIAAMAAAPGHGAEPPTANGSADQPPTAGVVPVAAEAERAAAGGATTEFRTSDEPEADPAAVASVTSKGSSEPARSRARLAAGLPRVRRPGARAARARAGRVRDRGRSSSRSRLAVMLPIAVVLVALLVALSVAGVFAANDPASSPRVDVPADAPADTEPADVVVVPGADQASSDDVEQAKARERARTQRKRDAAAKPESGAQTPATPPPAAVAPPAAAATNPPPPPPAPDATADDGSSTSGRSPKVDAGSGATGAEQIPPSEDTSSVPDLAPPPEPVTAP